MLGRVAPHLTLVPPVNVRVEDLPGALALARAAAAASAGALRLRLGPVTTFAPVTPTIYLAVTGELDRLRALRDTVFAGPFDRRLDHEFVPHVTVAQEQLDGSRLAAAVEGLAAYEVDVTVERLHVLEEVAGAGPGGGRAWVPLADAPLGPPTLVGRGGLELTLTDHDTLDPEAAVLLGLPGGRLAAGRFAALARRGDTVVGAALATCVVAAGQVEEARLDSVVVAEAVRREGVGRHLVEHVGRLARDAGAARLTGPAERVDDRLVDWLVDRLGWRPGDRSPPSAGPWRPL